MGEVSKEWNKYMSLLSSRKEKKWIWGVRPVSLTCIPGKGANNPGNITKDIKDKKVIENSQHRYTMDKSCLTNLTTCYDDLTSVMDEERAVNVIYLDRKKAFDTVFHNILTDMEDEVQPVYVDSKVD